jgi:hypothetical protein
MLAIRAVNLYRRKFDDALLHVEGVVPACRSLAP